MNDNLITESVDDAVNDIAASEPIRKIGFINGFTTCDEGYLAFVCENIGLGADLSEMKKLQAIFKSLGRCPTVAELFFALKGLRTSKEFAESETLLAHAELPDDNVKFLLSDLVRRYSTDCGTIGKAPVITRLARYAVTGRDTQPECGMAIELKDYRALPPIYNSGAVSVSSGCLSLTLSKGKPFDSSKRGNICVLISAEDNNYSDETMSRILAACKKIARAFRGTVIKPTSRFGLMHDLAEYSDGLWIDTALLPSPTEFAEDVFDAPPPSFLIFTNRAALPAIWQIAWEFGIVPKAPVSLRTGNITVKAEAGMIDLDRKIMSMFNWEIMGNMGFDADAIGGIGETERLEIFGGEYSVEVFSLDGGNIYGALEDIMSDRDADYAVGGVINISDSKALPAILSFDAYRRNCSPSISYAKFFIGDRTNIRIFKIKANNRN